MCSQRMNSNCIASYKALRKRGKKVTVCSQRGREDNERSSVKVAFDPFLSIRSEMYKWSLLNEQ